MDKLLEKVGNNIREARKEISMSQEGLAGKAELDRTYISSVERGQKNISILSLDKIARALGVTLGSLFE